MLNKLLNMLQNIVPIKTLLDHNGYISIEYYDANLPNETQLTIINSILQEWPLNKAKLEKIQILDKNWKQVINIGWTTSYGYKLGIDIQDITLLNGAFTLAKEASSMGITNLIPIVDLDGMSHQLSLQDLTILMVQYGQARSLLSNSYASIKQAINSAASVEELNSVNLTIGA